MIAFFGPRYLAKGFALQNTQDGFTLCAMVVTLCGSGVLWRIGFFGRLMVNPDAAMPRILPKSDPKPPEYVFTYRGLIAVAEGLAAGGLAALVPRNSGRYDLERMTIDKLLVKISVVDPPMRPKSGSDLEGDTEFEVDSSKVLLMIEALQHLQDACQFEDNRVSITNAIAAQRAHLPET